MPRINIERYYEHFSPERRAEALKLAHEIRRFEIDLYWKRAAYFWTFIAAAFGAYFLLQKEGAEFASVYIVTCLGFLFSLAWYLVNRGSGSWQRNWEAHVDLLEDSITGPLHKTLIDRNSYHFLELFEPYPFSPSRINNILSFGVTLIWLFLIVRTLRKAKVLLPFADFQPPFSFTATSISVFTIIISMLLVWKGRARRNRPKTIGATDIQLRIYRSVRPPTGFRLWKRIWRRRIRRLR